MQELSTRSPCFPLMRIWVHKTELSFRFIISHVHPTLSEFSSSDRTSPFFNFQGTWWLNEFRQLTQSSGPRKMNFLTRAQVYNHLEFLAITEDSLISNLFTYTAANDILFGYGGFSAQPSKYKGDPVKVWCNWILRIYSCKLSFVYKTLMLKFITCYRIERWRDPRGVTSSEVKGNAARIGPSNWDWDCIVRTMSTIERYLL